MSAIPVVDVSDLRPGGDAERAAREIGRACRDHGFFYAVGHGVPEINRLRKQFAQIQRMMKQAKNAAKKGKGGRSPLFGR